MTQITLSVTYSTVRVEAQVLVNNLMRFAVCYSEVVCQSGANSDGVKLWSQMDAHQLVYDTLHH